MTNMTKSCTFFVLFAMFGATQASSNTPNSQFNWSFTVSAENSKKLSSLKIGTKVKIPCDQGKICPATYDGKKFTGQGESIFFFSYIPTNDHAVTNTRKPASTEESEFTSGDFIYVPDNDNTSTNSRSAISSTTEPKTGSFHEHGKHSSTGGERSASADMAAHALDAGINAGVLAGIKGVAIPPSVQRRRKKKMQEYLTARKRFDTEQQRLYSNMSRYNAEIHSEFAELDTMLDNYQSLDTATTSIELQKNATEEKINPPVDQIRVSPEMLSDRAKVDEASDILKRLKNDPIDWDKTVGSQTLSNREKSVMRGLSLINNTSDTIADQRWMENQKSLYSFEGYTDIAVDFSTGKPNNALIEALKKAVTPDVVGDGTLYGVGARNLLRKQLNAEAMKIMHYKFGMGNVYRTHPVAPFTPQINEEMFDKAPQFKPGISKR